MKKIILSSLVALLSLSLAMPVLATNDNDENRGVEKIKKQAVSVVYQPRAVTARGSITAISGLVLPADVTVKLEKITPKSLKNYPGTFPVESSAVIMHLTKDAKIVRKYMGKADFSELAIGDKVSVTGKLQNDGTINVSMIKDESVHVIFNAKKGAVTAVDVAGNSFVVKNNDKEFKIFVTADTKIAKAGLVKPTLADLKAGDDVVVRGVVRQSANEITADLVVIKIGEKEKTAKQLEVKKLALKKKIETVKSNLAKMQTELETLLKKISEATVVAPIVAPVVAQ